MLMFCAVVWLPSSVKRGEAHRSYFGVYRVQTSADGDYHTLVHGTTLHGAQRIRDEEGKRGRGSRARDLLLRGQPDRADHRQGARAARRHEGHLRRHRPRRRLARLPLQAGRDLALLRDRSGGGRHRQQPALLHVPVAMPAQARHRAGRRAADHGQAGQRHLRSHHRRCLLLRRRARAPDDGGGDPALPRQGQARRHRSAAHLQPLPRSRLGAGRHHQGAAGRARASSSPTTRRTAATASRPRRWRCSPSRRRRSTRCAS